MVSLVINTLPDLKIKGFFLRCVCLIEDWSSSGNIYTRFDVWIVYLWFACLLINQQRIEKKERERKASNQFPKKVTEVYIGSSDNK